MGQLTKTREMVAVGLFTALTCIVALVFKWGGEILVPFSFLPMMALLAGVLLGSRAGAMSMTAYLLMGLVGFPVFSKAPYGGPMYILQPTFGFILGFIIAAYLTGKVIEMSKEPNLLHYGMAMAVGIVAYYVVGLPYLWLMVNFYLGKAMTAIAVIKVAFLPFIGLDLIKAALATLLARAVARRVRLAVQHTS